MSWFIYVIINGLTVMKIAELNNCADSSIILTTRLSSNAWADTIGKYQ
ncbi:hypothetical protein RHORCCE3_1995 [Rickettsia hoogstraalii str. RCCE3]|nr:hypothetical protein RHORCCE3_1995 [Rickettsia hoogstraalii str. RCCE3]